MAYEERERAAEIAALRKSCMEFNQELVKLVENSNFTRLRFERESSVSHHVQKALKNLVEVCKACYPQKSLKY